MRIAIYHPWIYVKSGLERTIMEIKRRSRHDWVVFTSHYDAERTYPEFRSLNVRELERVSVERRYGEVIRGAWSIATSRLDEPGLDALVVCCDGLGSMINFANPALPSICLCFTPLRAVYDPVYRAQHLSRSLPRRLLGPIAELGYRMLDRLAWSRYRHVFCISREVESRVLAGGLCEPSKIEIAYPGIDEQTRRASGRFEPFFFLPGRIMWTKNIQLGIEGFRRFRRAAGRDFRLVIAGMVDAKSQGYYAELKRLAGDEGDVEFIVDPSDGQMRELYGNCYATLFTAFNEDLGITPLEAAAQGKPVIAVNRGGPREIVVDRHTGILAEPEPEAFGQAMQQLAGDPGWNAELGRNALERSAMFTWDRFVSTIDAYFDTSADRAR